MKARTILALVLAALAAPAALGQTAFSFQGQLAQGGVAANGVYDVRVRMYDAASGGNQVGPTFCFDNVPIVNGLFSTTLDFGDAFLTAASRFIEIEFRVDTGTGCGVSTGYNTLSPRTQVLSVPMATHARTAGALSALDGSPIVAVQADNNGRVGIGTSTPATSVHVLASDAHLRLDNVGPANFAALELTSPTRRWDVGVGGATSGALADKFYIYDITNNLPRLVIDAAGSVGIGTSSPAGPLDLRYGSSFIMVDPTYADLHFNGGSDGFFGFYNDGVSTGRTEFISGNGVNLSINNSDGNIGIGALPTASKLYVNGPIAMAPVVRTKTVHGSAFLPQHINDPTGGGTVGGRNVVDFVGSANSGSVGFSTSGGSPVPYYASLDLPDGAALVDLTLDARDGHATQDIVLNLIKTSLITGQVTTLATVFTSGSSTSTIQHPTIGDINETVDNNSYVYFLECTMCTSGSNIHWLLAARVHYSITAPLP
jgi:hypothetical protein